MPIIEEKDFKKIQTRLAPLKHPVRLVFFTQEYECEYCRLIREMLHTLTNLSTQLDLEIYDFVHDAEMAREYNIERSPAVVVRGEDDYGIRFFGAPAGYEFISFLHAIEIVGNKAPGLTTDSIKRIHTIKSPMRIRIFVTPSCPYCPTTVSLAHKIAMENPHITSEMIEIMEFPFLIQKHGIRGVPHILINDSWSFEGNLPEALFVEQILEAAKSNTLVV